jgi:ketosteroid isomerase-like protein
MQTRFVAALLALGMVAVLVVGCATTGGNKDQKSIDKTLAVWKAAIEKQDVDGMMPAYSDAFKSDRGEGKPEMKKFLASVKEQGYLDGAKVDMAKTEIKIEKNTATVSPIGLSSNAGAISVQLVMKPDPDKVWRIIASEEAH